MGGSWKWPPVPKTVKNMQCCAVACLNISCGLIQMIKEGQVESIYILHFFVVNYGLRYTPQPMEITICVGIKISKSEKIGLPLSAMWNFHISENVGDH